MTEPLLQAYKDLLTRAPGAAFRRARSLYLNKYPLPEASGQHALRLFVCNEQLVETMEPANDGNKAHRIVTLTTTVVQFALVHWQHQDAPADEALLARRCDEFQTRPESPFVQNLVVLQRRGDRHTTLRGRVLTERGPEGETQELLPDARTLVERLDQRFGLQVPEAAELWDGIRARHAALFPDET